MPDPLEQTVEFLRELKRRRVVHSILVYTGIAFLLLEGVGNLTDALRLPDTMEFACGVAVVLGFPVAAIVSWMYEWTGDGLRRAERAKLGSHTRIATAWALATLMALAGLGVGMLIGGSEEVIAAEQQPRPRAINQQPVLAILPFEHAGQDTEPLAAALEAHVENVLSASPTLTLRWRRALRPHLESGVPIDSLARILDIDYLIQAQVTRLGGEPSVVVQLADGRDMSVLGSARIEPQTGGSIALLDALTRGIEDMLRPTVGQYVRLRSWTAETDDSEALALRWRAHERHEAALDPDLTTEERIRQLHLSDSLLAVAANRDPAWREPRLACARLAIHKAIILSSAGRTDVLPNAYDRGLACIQEVLEMQPADPEALGLRGRLQWRRSFMLADEPGAAARVDRAEEDLRLAVDRDPNNAEAAVTLAELLYIRRARWDQAYQFSVKAYELDAYQDNWGQIVNRIALSAFEMGEDSIAGRWCREGLRREPTSPMHHGCALDVMAWGDSKPDPAAAWHHHDAIAEFMGLEEHPHPFYGFAVAGALARAQMADSARAVLERAKRALGPGEFPAAIWLEAGVRFRLGERRAGLRLYDQLVREYPDVAAMQVRRRVLAPFVNDRDVPSLPG